MSNGKCVIYCRVSSGGQLSGAGLSSQLTNCIRYAESKGWEVIEKFEDGGVSGGLLDRPGIIELFNFVHDYNLSNSKDKIGYFLCDDIDRLARGVEVHTELKKRMEILEMKLDFVNQNFEDTPEGKFVETILAGYAELHKDKNRAQVISRQTARLMDGYRPFNPPVGYNTITEPQGGKLMVIDKEKATIIKEGIEGYANGVFKSLPEVGKYWTRKGLIIAKKGTEVKPIHRSTVSRILNNILYTGHIHYQTITRHKDGRIKHERDVSLREGKHEGIISLQTFYDVQMKLNGRRPYTKPQQAVNDIYPLRGYLICHCCKLKLSSGTSRGNRKVDYYTFNKKCKGEGKGGIMPKVLHPQFKEMIDSVKADKKYIKFQRALLKAETKERGEEDKKNGRKLRAERKSLEEKESRIINVLTETDSKITRKRMEEKIEEIAMKMKTIDIKLRKIESNDDVLEKVMETAFKIMENPLMYREKGDTDQKRLLLNLLFRKPLEVHRDTQTFGTIELSPVFLLSEQFNAGVLQDLEVTGVEPVSRRHKQKVLPQ